MNPATHFLLLDIDGVLIQPDDFYGAKLSREYPAAFGEWMRTAFIAASTGKSDLLDDLPALMVQIGRRGDAEAFYREWLDYENVVHPPTLEAVKQLRLRGWRTYLATNQERHRTQHLLEVVGLGAVTDGHFASYAVGHRKPSAEYYALVTQQLNCQPEQIIFWDDSAENVAAARAAGWTAYLFTDVSHFRRVMGLDPE
ncbi:haloacid dehalogenase [Deinococcus piscis]|uniref:Haloacid dehalogenase n=1 Tax=Deinococcus piscis TaxID=394230 RepID=A0ABQ3K796_9DEIO|nr:HAD family phosphatase [Deinococcus piscis]GHG02965.1 haloacid dehalogenase [Deinococcus piscis]